MRSHLQAPLDESARVPRQNDRHRENQCADKHAGNRNSDPAERERLREVSPNTSNKTHRILPQQRYRLNHHKDDFDSI
jgi:hypothetical protein